MSREQEQMEDEQTGIIHVGEGALSTLTKSEVMMQLEAAHRFPRTIKRFLSDAISLATLDKNIAAQCLYAVPRDGKNIEGPSVRLAEICATSYGNLQIGARVVGTEDKEVISQGICWDLEKNVRITIEKRRRITKRDGKRFSDDMITTTGNAAASIALRDAVFKVIPRAYINTVYERAREVAVGSASTLQARRQEVIDELVKMGAMKERILAKIGKASLLDVTLDDLPVLLGYSTAIRQGEALADVLFPAEDASGASGTGGTAAQTDQRSRGTFNVDDIKKGKEENRGHGDEGLQQGKAKKEKPADPPPAEKSTGTDPTKEWAGPGNPPETEKADPGPCTAEDFIHIENTAAEYGLEVKVVRSHVMTKLGFKTYSQLDKKTVPVVIDWIKSHRKG